MTAAEKFAQLRSEPDKAPVHHPESDSEVSAGAMQLVRNGLQKVAPLAAFEAELQQTLASFQRIVVTDEVRAREVTDIVSRVKGAAKSFEDERTSLVKPLNDHVSTINARYKPIAKLLEQIEAAGKAAIGRYLREKEAKARAEAEAAAEEARLKAEAEARAKREQEPESAPADMEQPPLPVPPPEPPRSASQVRTFGGSTASTRKVWKFEITDFALVPDRYKQIDNAEVNQAIKDGARTIPGLRIYEDSTVAIR